LGTICAAAPFCGRTSVHVPKRLTLGLGPPSGVRIGCLSGVGALWDCVSRVCGGGGGCAGGGVPLGAGPCCPDVGRCLSGVNIIIISILEPHYALGLRVNPMFTTKPHTVQLWVKSVGAVRLRALPFSLVQQGCRRCGVSRCGPAAAVVGRGC